MNRRITIELEFEASADHPLQNMAQLESLLRQALENGISAAGTEIPAVLSANVTVVGAVYL